MRAIFCILLLTFSCLSYLCNSYQYNKKWPKVGIAVLIRNKYRSLPYFFSCLDRLDYPKDRLYIWIWTDYNEDNTEELVAFWANNHQYEYHGIYVTTNSTTGPLQKDQRTSSQWTMERFRHVMKLREKALMFAKSRWADFLLMLDADAYLTNPRILKHLVSKDLAVVAPMLISDGLYSNFWGAMTNSYYYKRSEDYRQIYKKEKVGCFNVPMIHTAVLINMNHIAADYLTYSDTKVSYYDGPIDDIIVFALSATMNNFNLTICNDEHAGFVQVPLDQDEDPKLELERVMNIKTFAAQKYNQDLPLDAMYMMYALDPDTKFGLDEIFVINLARRKNRLEYMTTRLNELGIGYKIFKAVDGLTLNLQSLPRNARPMRGYRDPYHNRPMKAGEIGCFLSHYAIWEEVIEKDMLEVMVLEDDVRFRTNFRYNLRRLLKEIEGMDWDLVYLGRKVLSDSEEERVTQHTVRPRYSYWTIGYLLSNRGARKLIAAQPLQKMLPVDEFLPVMFDQHPNVTIKAHFPDRNLNALSAMPLLIEPMAYLAEPGYVSDTEDSVIINEEEGFVTRQAEYREEADLNIYDVEEALQSLTIGRYEL